MEQVYVYTGPMAVAGQLSAIVTVPADFDPARESLPVILFLHGLGERGNDTNQLKIYGIPKLFTTDPDYHGLRVITVSPQCPIDFIWTHLTCPLKDWFMTFVESVNGDTNRLTITGLSMGGFGTWDMIMTFPHLFAAAAPVCGGGTTWRAGGLAGKPLRVYHGLDDPIVPFRYSLEMVEAGRAFGADVDLIAYDKVGHGSWVPAYEQSDLVEWLASCRLN